MLKILIGLFCLLATGILWADSIRCDTRLVSSGATKAEVILRCGEPNSKETTQLLKTEGFVKDKYSKEVIVEQWTYNFGKGTLLRLLTFQGGVLQTVEFGARVD